MKKKHRPLVKTPRLISKGKTTPKWRTGKGFSLLELEAAGITIDLAKKLGIHVDKRRKSKHEENIKYLGKILEEYRKTKT